MARQRDYKAEYARRVERGRELGLSRPQARGHARASEPKASTVINLIKQVQPERVKPKRKVAAKAPRQTAQRRQRTLKEPGGKRTKVKISQGTHNKTGKETTREVPATQFTGKTESRLGNVLETVARQAPNSHVIIEVTDKEGNKYTIGSHGGINAATLAESLSEMSLDEYLESIYGRWGQPFDGYGQIASWSMTVI